MERITPYHEALLGVSNLDINQAKTLVYYCIMTWSDVPSIRPLLNLNGESGTGKTSIMNQILLWCRDPKWINARRMTEAQFRDELADTITVLIDEADKANNLGAVENWLQNRYQDIATRALSYRRLRASGSRNITAQETHNHFGYTILHTQTPIESPEMDRRTLQVTLFKDQNRMYKTSDLGDNAPLKQISSEVDWNKRLDQTASNSAWDLWLPFLRVATCIGDTEYIDYVHAEIGKKMEEDQLTALYEPKGIVVGEIGHIYQKCLDEGKKHIAITDIRSTLTDRGYSYTERQIVKMAKDLDFTIVYPRNKAHVRVESNDQLRSIVSRAGVEENFYTAEAAPVEAVGDTLPMMR